jgi:hypothetical protein
MSETGFLKHGSPTERSHIILILLIASVILHWTGRKASGEGIPEPGLVFYGVVRNVLGGGSVRLTSGTLTWRLVPSGGGPAVLVSVPLTNINDQFSYVLQVPCEAPIAGFSLSANVLPLTATPVLYSRLQVEIDGVPAQFMQPSLTNFTVSAATRGRLERIDLVTAFQPTDSDGDGMPDAWECQYFGCNADPNQDVDGDGMSNLAEYRAGTDPTNAQSAFKFIDIQAAPQGGVELRWASVTNKRYSILRSTSLLGGFAELQRDVPATPPVNTFQDPDATGAGPYFYRLTVAY